MNDPIEVADGKYTFFISSVDGLLNCLRHREPWPAFREQGAHFAGSSLALYHALRAEKQRTQDLELVVTSLESTVDALQAVLAERAE